MKIYLDTNVIIDFIKKRNNKVIKIIDEGISCKHNFVISDFTLFELNKVGIRYEMFLKVLQSVKKYESCKLDLGDTELAKKDKITHLQDAIHIVLCDKCSADALLTSNTKDFRHYYKTASYDDILTSKSI